MSTHAEFWEPSQVSHFRPFCVAFRIFHFLRNEHPLDDAPGVRPFYFWRARQLRLEGFRNLLFSTEAMGPETLIVRVGFVLSWPCFASISQNTCCIKERLVLLRLNPMGQDMASQSPSWLCLDGWQALELRLIFHKLLPHSHNLTHLPPRQTCQTLLKDHFHIFSYIFMFFFSEIDHGVTEDGVEVIGYCNWLSYQGQAHLWELCNYCSGKPAASDPQIPINFDQSCWKLEQGHTMTKTWIY